MAGKLPGAGLVNRQQNKDPVAYPFSDDVNPQRTTKATDPTSLVFLFDGVFMNISNNAYRVSARHNNNKFTNVLFLDGHAATFNTNDTFTTDFNQYRSVNASWWQTHPYPRFRFDQ